MFLRISTLFLLILCLNSPASTQTVANVVIGSDLRLFATMAALNAAGFDIELASQYHPVRTEVRQAVEALDPALKQQLREFYQARKGNEPDETQIAKYISLALSLTDPPDLRPAFREENLPPDARSVLGFAELVREVYRQGNLSQLWTRVTPQYDREMNAMGRQIRQTLVLTDAYLRIPLGSSGQRHMAIYVELAAPVNSVNVRSNQDNYYVVFGSSSAPRLEELRHAYLHFQLDNVVANNLQKVKNRASLIAIINNEPDVQPEFISDFRLLVTESLIRALEVRMDRTAAAPAKERIDGFYRSGLLLAPYFYENLSTFEQQEEGIREYFDELAENVDVGKERTRFQTTFHNIPAPIRQSLQAEAPAAPPAPAPNPLRDRLKEGEAALNAGELEKAQAAFQDVLTNHDRTNGAALYGLALIARREGDVDSAERFFEDTTRSASADGPMKVWAYIYLAQLFDLQCERERAVGYYEQAVKIGDNTRNAQEVAKQGLTTPYGDECR